MKSFHNLIAILFFAFLIFLSCSTKMKVIQQKKLEKYPMDSSGVVYDFFDTDIKLKIIEKAKPDYPKEAIAKKLNGIVIVKAIISPNGECKAIGVKNSVHPLLDKAAMEAAERSKFEPAIKDGKRVTVKMFIPFVFKLE